MLELFSLDSLAIKASSFNHLCKIGWGEVGGEVGDVTPSAANMEGPRSVVLILAMSSMKTRLASR